MLEIWHENTIYYVFDCQSVLGFIGNVKNYWE
jgi:hypothetical protein